MDEAAIRQALKAVRFPGFSRDIVSFGIVRKISQEEGTVNLHIVLPKNDPAISQSIEEGVRKVLLSLPDISDVRIEMGHREESAKPGAGGDPWAGQAPIPGVKSVVAVASGKGGVGKSTVAVNLAVALAGQGYKIGLMDADIYGPSLPMMLGGNERPTATDDHKILPAAAHGVKYMSIGFFIEDETAVIWRGLMVMKIVEQFLRDVAWGDLDMLLVDLPPGTGDAQLTLAQKVPLTGAIIVTTPQDLAFTVARRGLMMFRKINVPVLGIIENMSWFHCPHCGERTDIFSHGGGKATSRALEVPFLAEIPLDPEIRAGGDAGRPIVTAAPESPASRSFVGASQTIMKMAQSRQEKSALHLSH